jgi:hypothetical protein
MEVGEKMVARQTSAEPSGVDAGTAGDACGSLPSKAEAQLSSAVTLAELTFPCLRFRQGK